MTDLRESADAAAWNIVVWLWFIDDLERCVFAGHCKMYYRCPGAILRFSSTSHCVSV